MLKDTREKIRKLDLQKYCSVQARVRGNSLPKIARSIGMDYRTLLRRLEKPDLDVGLIIELSHALDENLLQFYVRFLPATANAFNAERDLQKRIAELEAEVARLKEKVGEYWELLKGR